MILWPYISHMTPSRAADLVECWRPWKGTLEMTDQRKLSERPGCLPVGYALKLRPLYDCVSTLRRVTGSRNQGIRAGVAPFTLTPNGLLGNFAHILVSSSVRGPGPLPGDVTRVFWAYEL